MRAYLAIIRPYNILLTLLTQAVFMVAASRTNYINIDWENISFPQSYLVILTCCLTAAEDMSSTTSLMLTPTT